MARIIRKSDEDLEEMLKELKVGGGRGRCPHPRRWAGIEGHSASAGGCPQREGGVIASHWHGQQP